MVLVLLFHLDLPWISGGFVGVDVFFVISGFLITSIIRTDIEAGRFSVLRFYDRRVRRIIPALVGIYIFCALVAPFVLLPSDLIAFGESLVASAFFVSNFLFYAEAGYFAAPSLDKPLLHTWSLSVEEQYYLFWPLIMWAAYRFLHRRGLIALLATGLLASLALSEWQLGWDRAGAFFLITSRAWELALGGLLAFTATALLPGRRLADALSLAGLAAILLSAVLLTERSGFPGVNALATCLGTALLLVSGQQGRGLVNRLFSWRPVVLVGLVSYSLYLWHWPLIVFARYYLERPFRPAEMVALVAVSFIAAVLSYRFIESPFRRHPGPEGAARDVRARRSVAAGMIAVTLCALVGATMLPGGWTWRLPESALQVDRLAAAPHPFRKACDGLKKAAVDPPDCTLGSARADGGYDVAIIGDSHADHLVAGFDKLLARHGLSGRQVTTSGCIPVFGVRVFDDLGRETCQDFEPAIEDFLDRHPEVRLVVVAARWAVFSETRWLESERGRRRFLIDARSDVFSRENSRRVLTEGLRRTVDSLTARGVRVLLMGQVPPMSSRRSRCMTRARWFGGDETACYEPAANALARVAFANAAIAGIAAGDARVDAFFPGDVLCNAEFCVPVLDGVFLFRDEDHLNPTGSELLLDRLPLPIARRP